MKPFGMPHMSLLPTPPPFLLQGGHFRCWRILRELAKLPSEKERLLEWSIATRVARHRPKVEHYAVHRRLWKGAMPAVAAWKLESHHGALVIPVISALFVCAGVTPVVPERAFVSSVICDDSVLDDVVVWTPSPQALFKIFDLIGQCCCNGLLNAQGGRPLRHLRGGSDNWRGDNNTRDGECR